MEATLKIEQQQPEQYPEDFGKFETSLERGIQSAGINMSSGDSPRHRGGRPTIGMTLRPESVTEKSFMESMAGFIHEVVPQAYGGSPPNETRDPILWARIEQLDCSDCLSQNSDAHGNNLPLLLVLGYATGVQVWALLASGEAQEILSWRQGSTKVFRLLPSPELTGSTVEDLFAAKRPLVAVCDNTVSGHGSPFYPVTFLSLRTGEQVKTIRFKNPVSDVYANRRVVVVTFPEKVAVFNSSTLEDQFVLTHCYLSTSPCPNPVALGTRWLAYAEKRLLPIHRSGGGFEGEGIQSYTATVIHAAKSLTKGLRDFGETFASSLTGQRPTSSATNVMTATSPTGPQPGVVTVIDLDGVGRGEVNLREDVGGVVAHFVAHANQAISFLAFDPSGSLLFTADRQGHNFNIFRLLPAPCGTKQSAVHHLYTLYRGDTTAKVQDVAFATDSRWVAVTTFRGTTHVFPISPYGGAIGVRTHASSRVVNRLSRFHRSAGLDDGYTPSSGRNSPVLSGSPGNSRHVESAALFPYPNPRVAPYPYPTVVSPLAQIRSASILGAVPGRGALASTAALTARPSRSQNGDDELGASGQPLRVSCCFAPPRGAANLGSLGVHNHVAPSARDRLQRRTAESLYIISCHGTLVEYGLEPRLAAGIAREKACDESAIDLDVVPCAQWLLHKPVQSQDLVPPLSNNSLMLITRGPEPGENVKNSETPATGTSRVNETPETWLAQVEINTHAGPHRRLWMGPQFTFKTLKRDSTTSLSEIEASEVDILSRPARSNPVNMPETMDVPIQGLPVITGEGSASSYEQSPRFLTACGRDRFSAQRCDSESSISGMSMTDTSSLGPKVEVELQLKENLADAMIEMPTSGSRLSGEEESSGERRTHYFMDDDRLNWSPSSLLAASNPPPSLLSNDEALLDLNFEFDSDMTTCPSLSSQPLNIKGKMRHSSKGDDSSSDNYSFFASDEVVTGQSVDVAFFPDASRSAGESSSNEEDVVTVSSSLDDGSKTEKKSRKNRKKKK